MPEIINITEARQRFTDLVRELGESPVYVTVHGKPRAVVVRYDVFEALLEKIEDLEDNLDVLARRGGPVRDFEEAMAEIERVPSPA
jgi:prevent-host-death family protein